MSAVVIILVCLPVAYKSKYQSAISQPVGKFGCRHNRISKFRLTSANFKEGFRALKTVPFRLKPNVQICILIPGQKRLGGHCGKHEVRRFQLTVLFTVKSATS